VPQKFFEKITGRAVSEEFRIRAPAGTGGCLPENPSGMALLIIDFIGFIFLTKTRGAGNLRGMLDSMRHKLLI